jgi:hypothetical protein
MWAGGKRFSTPHINPSQPDYPLPPSPSSAGKRNLVAPGRRVTPGVFYFPRALVINKLSLGAGGRSIGGYNPSGGDDSRKARPNYDFCPAAITPFPSQSLDAAAQVAIDAHVGLRASVATIVNAEAHLSATAFLTADASVISPLKPTLATSALIIPEQRVNEGVLIKSTSVIWLEIID